MIEQQQEVIRRTHRGEETRDGKPSLPEGDRGDLSRAEDELAKGTEHLAARLVAATRNHPAVQDPVARLGEAGTSLKDAAGRLRDDAVTDVLERRRRRGPAASAPCRRRCKRFQKAVADHPDAFPKPEKEPLARQPAPKDMLDRIAEFRDERRAGQEFVEQTLAQQKQIGQKAQTRAPDGPGPGQEARSARARARRVPQATPAGVPGGRAAVRRGQPGAQAGGAGAPPGRSEGRATTGPGRPEARRPEPDAPRSRAVRRQQLADAYRLKEMLDQEIGQFARVEKDPAALRPKQVRRTTAPRPRRFRAAASGHRRESAHSR